jgi:hypothetical protein
MTFSGDVDNLAAFLSAVNWKVIYGLNGVTTNTNNSNVSSVALSTEEAAYVESKLGTSLFGFEIGNEPDLYYANGLEGSSFTFADFTGMWQSYYSSIIGSVTPMPLFSGPASAYDYSSYTVPFAGWAGSEINLLTQHFYVANGKSSPEPTIDDLLESLDSTNAIYISLITELQALESASSAYANKYRFAEANSFYNGGAPGISDDFGSALWALEFCFTLAMNGASGVNFHGGGNSAGYTPIANYSSGVIVQARAEYYGILLFSQVANGTILNVTESGTASALFSYSVSENDGSYAVILANNSRTDIVNATVNMPGAFTSASNMTMTAPAIDSTNGMTLGGSSVNANGSWSPQFASQPLSNSGTSFSVIVPSGSAVWIKLIK